MWWLVLELLILKYNNIVCINPKRGGFYGSHTICFIPQDLYWEISDEHGSGAFEMTDLFTIVKNFF